MTGGPFVRGPLGITGGPFDLTGGPFYRGPPWLYLIGGPFVRGPIWPNRAPFYEGAP